MIITIILGIVSLSLGVFLWFIINSLDMFLNGGESLYKNFLQNISWLSSKNRGNYIKDRVERFDSGWIGEYTYEEIRERKIYAKVANKVLPSRFQIIYYNVAVPLTPIIIFYLYLFKKG